MSYQVQLEKFTGPMDLLLKLIEDKNLDITSIALSEVTANYISYLENIQEIRSEDLGDFLVIASTLILIKSKAILPTIELTPQEEKEILDLETRLTLYRFFKDTGLRLKDLINHPPYLFSREPWLNQRREFLPPTNVDISKLNEALVKVLEQFKEEAPTLPEGEIRHIISLEERITQLIDRLTKHKGFKFSEVADKHDKIEVIITFLAILHLAKEKIINVKQDSPFGELHIKSNQNNG